ncbi:MAG: CinA family protein [Opitutae bacterium]|nr:CinA family protein [Opitutae bacterium]
MTELRELLLRAPRWKIAVAESLTCGRVQARIGEVSGASDYFLGGITAYALEEKVRLLGVEPTHAAAVNCFSATVAEQMARGVCGLFGAEVGLATTGYAEPSVEWGVTQPAAWWAVAIKTDRDRFSLHSGLVECPGANRIEAQERVATTALAVLLPLLREVRRAE